MLSEIFIADSSEIAKHYFYSSPVVSYYGVNFLGIGSKQLMDLIFILSGKKEKLIPDKTESDEGPWIYLLHKKYFTDLENANVSEIAEKWIELTEFDYDQDEITVSKLEDALNSLKILFKESIGNDIFLWESL